MDRIVPDPSRPTYVLEFSSKLHQCDYSFLGILGIVFPSFQVLSCSSLYGMALHVYLNDFQAKLHASGGLEEVSNICACWSYHPSSP